MNVSSFQCVFNSSEALSGGPPTHSHLKGFIFFQWFFHFYIFFFQIKLLSLFCSSFSYTTYSQFNSSLPHSSFVTTFFACCLCTLFIFPLFYTPIAENPVLAKLSTRNVSFSILPLWQLLGTRLPKKE